MRAGRARGFIYLGVLLSLAMLGVGLAVASEVWTTVARRQRLARLEWIGQQFVQAIGSYYDTAPGRNAKKYPKSLDDLLEDRRYPHVRRHLRRIYVNPFSGTIAWETLPAADGGIQGVRARIPDALGNGSIVKDFSHVPVKP